MSKFAGVKKKQTSEIISSTVLGFPDMTWLPLLPGFSRLDEMTVTQSDCFPGQLCRQKGQRHNLAP